jgi:hypothetical protein
MYVSRHVIATVAAICLVVAGASSATAAEASSEDQAANLIADVAPDQGEVVTGVTGANRITADVGTVEIAVPVDPQASIEIAPSNPSAPTLRVNLPEEVTAGSGRVAKDGTIVYEGDGNTDASVQVLADGSVRLQTITHAATDSQEFTYTFGEGITPVDAGDGTIALVQRAGSALMTVGSVDKAWAVDADGRQVATEYRVEGDALVQVVSPDQDASFPVVADPKITYALWNFTVYFNKWDTITIATGAAGCAVVTVLIPDPTVSKVVAVTCGLLSVFAADASARGNCVKLVKYAYIGPAVLQQYGGSEAGGYCK